MIRVKKTVPTRIQQGDIYKDIEYIEYLREEKGQIQASKIVFPYVIVLTQDCDLAQDNTFRKSPTEGTQDNLLFSVLVAPLYNAEHVYTGEHLSELELKMEPISKNKTPGKYLNHFFTCTDV